MFLKTLRIAVLLLGASLTGSAQAAPALSESVEPLVATAMTTFYYHDMRKAAAWYQNALGLKVVTDKGWIVIFQVTSTAYLGVVTANDGSLHPTKDKGAMISIETDALDDVFQKLKDRPGLNLIHGIQPDAKGMIREFRMFDPEGYQIEFFSWAAKAKPKRAGFK